LTDDVRGALLEEEEGDGSTGPPAAGRSTAGENDATTGGEKAEAAAAAGRGLSNTAAAVEEEDEGDGGETEAEAEAVAARKQFWQRFLVAGFPGKPQLLAQSVSSGACSSVGSSTFLSR
jgi:hypothetical protein